MSSEHEFDVSYSTGFLAFDFMNGNIVRIKRATGEEESYSSIGLVDGSITTIIGRSGCGKTTYAVQVASNIIRPFNDADMYIDDRNFGGLPDWGVIYDMITNNWTFYDYFEKLYAEQEDKPRGFWQRLFGKKD